VRRAEILRSIPDGMSLAAYLHVGDADVRRFLRQGPLGRRAGGPGAAVDTAAGRGEEEDDDGGAAPAPFQLPGIPFDIGALLPWCGDELGLALLGVESTPLAPIPNFALLVEVRDAELARGGLGALESLASMVTIGGGPRREFVDVAYGGRTYRSLAQPLVEAVTPSYLLDGDIAVISSTRQLMHQIIDTRRVGKRHLLTDDSFQPFRDFVPDAARLVLYADQHRLRRVTDQLGGATSNWNPTLARGVQDLQAIAAVMEHFPAAAVYMERSSEQLTVRGWMLEND
jgi:hypothetical protein